MATSPTTPARQPSPDTVSAAGGGGHPLFGLRHGVGEHAVFDLTAFGVETVQFFGDRQRLLAVAGAQEAVTEVGGADAPSGVDPRPQEEPDVIGPRRLLDAGDVAQRGEAGVAAARQHPQALADEGAVEAGERRHVANAAERHQVEEAEQVGFAAGGEEPARAQDPVDRDDEEEGDPDGGQRPLPARVVGAVGVHQRVAGGRPFAGGVVIDDNDLQPFGGRGGERFGSGGAAIDGHDEPRALAREAPQRRQVRPVAFAPAVGNVDADAPAHRLDIKTQQRRGGRAVHVVVAEDADGLAGLQRVGEARCGAVHVGDRGRIGERVAQGGVQPVRRAVQGDPAAGEDAAEDLRNVEPLREGESEAVAVAARLPTPVGLRTRDSEKRRPGVRAPAIRCHRRRAGPCG